MSSWLFVVGDGKALEWVVANETMAFRQHVRPGSVRPGDRFALYVTRGAYHNPTRDEARIHAVGTAIDGVKSPVTVVGERFPYAVRVRFDRHPLPMREGLPFRPLVSEMSFIRSKRGWAAYVRRALVEISEQDLKRIDAALTRYERISRGDAT